jgi:hypothetical protein
VARAGCGIRMVTGMPNARLGIVTLTSRGQYEAEGCPTAPIMLRVGRKSPGARV